MELREEERKEVRERKKGEGRKEGGNGGIIQEGKEKN